jgi:hypothetical protein
VGDGRRSLAATPDGFHDLIVLDAFSSDAIPIHLLTREAVALYLSKLRPDGLLAFHVSNRHLRLAPVLAGVGHSLGVVAAERFDWLLERQRVGGKAPSHWIVLARSEARLKPLLDRQGWRLLWPDRGSRVWTDDFSNILSVIDCHTESFERGIGRTARVTQDEKEARRSERRRSGRKTARQRGHCG